MKIEALPVFGVCVSASGALDPHFIDELLLEHRLVVLRGFEALSRDAFRDACAAFPSKQLLHWASGPVMEMRVEPDAPNYLFTREAVPFHWDGAFHTVPTYLAFHCLAAPDPDAGGETLFCDTQKIWDEALPEERSAWETVRLTFETAKLAHYGGRITVPLTTRHPTTGRPGLRFAEPVFTEKNPVALIVEGATDGAAFVAGMQRRIYAPEYCYRHVWRTGDYLFADNHALIHGRRPFTETSPRHLRRIQIL